MDDLITQLLRNSEALASGITPPGIGSDPAHFLTGQAAAKIESDAKVIAALREKLKLMDDYYQIGGDLMSHMAHMAQDALAIIEQTVGESDGR